MTIGENLQRLRKDAKTTQQQLADYLGINQSLVASYERDTKPVPLQTAKKIVDFFGCTFDDFFS